MTAYDLQVSLAAEVERITKDMLFQTPAGEQERLKAFLQCLPERPVGLIGEGEDEEDPYPYCIVRIDSGSIATPMKSQEVKVILIFGIFDNSHDRNAHQAILNIIQRIADRFTRDPLLDHKYRLNYEDGINWVMDDEEPYPYYFGAMNLTWDTAWLRREDNYA